MTEEKKTKKDLGIYLGPHVVEVSTQIMDELLFETILDYLRKKRGFPSAKPLSELLSVKEIIPKPDFIIKNERNNLAEKVQCPICLQDILIEQYANHLHNCKDKNEQERIIESAKLLFP